MTGVWFGILGPVEVRAADGTPMAVGGPRPRALLALLLLETGHVVGTGRLIDGLYGEAPPRDAANALQAQISRLRRVLGDGVIESHPAGYRLAVDPEQVDAHRFTRLAAEGRQELAAGRAEPAATLLAEALTLWRGPAEVPAARLDELRLSAVEDRVEAELARGGDAAALVAELREFVEANPLRERFRGLLMRALQASGRQAEALTVFEDARRTLAGELGADPSAELAGTHLAILTAEEIRTTGVPAQLTTFVGRDEELNRVREQLTTARLVTVTGPGGMGKTRLAVQVGTDVPDACFVDLWPLTDGRELPQAVLAALGLREIGLTPSPHRPPDPVARLAAALRDRPLLLILDNCEHVVAESATLVHGLLTVCPSLRVLATSREPLGITGEALCPLVPLSESAAVRLFADRARAVSPGFAVTEAVPRICRALDGLPLAIELAAARLRSLTVDQVEARLDDRFRLLSRGSRTAAPRHRTLRAVVSWSWDLLGPREQRALRGLAVFAGGATADAATAVLSEMDTGADTGVDTGVDTEGNAGVDTEDLLDDLAAKSLLEATAGRYRMLDTIREFSAGQAAGAGETDRFARAHAEHFLGLAREADPHLRGAEQLTWLARLTAEHANLRAALRWAVHSDPPLALKLVGALTTYWRLRGVRGEIAPLATELLQRLEGREPPEDLAEEYVLTVLSALPGPPPGTIDRAREIMRAPRYPPRLPALLVAWALFTGPPEPGDLLDPVYEAFGESQDPWLNALIHFSLSYAKIFAGERAGAEAEFATALAGFRSVGDRWGIAQVLDGLSALADHEGDWRRALSLATEAIAEMTRLGAVEEIAELSCRRADLLLRGGELDAAESGYRQAEELARRVGVPATLAMTHHGRGKLADRRGDQAEARRRFRLALQACGPDWQSICVRSRVLAWIAVLDGDGGRAAHLLGASAAIGDTVHNPEIVGRVERITGKAGYDKAFARGSAMSREAALACLGGV
jgi:predicted ATPase/DNA-binding SARP family transcriptional activator